MPKWYFSKDRIINRTPSRVNGVDFTTESRYRREGCRFIMEMGNKLGLRYDTMATGVIYFHRFYMKQSFKTFPRWVTACACLFLAGKVEETPKKCRDIIKVAKSMLSDHHFQLFGENPREEVMMYERVLLQTIKFDLQVDHPYAILLKIGKLLKGDKGKVQKLVQMAWTFVNDSLATNLCIRTKPEILAIAHLNLAGKLANFDLKSSTDSPSNKPWWVVFNKDCTEAVVEEICNEMLELYGEKKKEKPKQKIISDKNEPSPNNSSSTSSPSVTNSPPFKKQRTTGSSRNADGVGKPVPSVAISQPSKMETKPTPVTTSTQIPSVSITNTTRSCAVEPPLVENVSPAIVSDSLPVSIVTSAGGRTSYTVPSSTAPSKLVVPVPSVVLPPRLPTSSYINTVPPRTTYLPTGMYPGTAFGMMQPQGTESIIPGTNSSFLPRTPQVDPLYPQHSLPPGQKPGNYGQSFSNIPPPLPSAHQPPPQVQPRPPLSQARPLYPPHHQLPPQQNPPPQMNLMPPHMVNNQMPPGGNNPNWRPPYNRPPSNNPPPRGGGWLR